ncbi:MAG: glycosyltransferase family 4 protein [Candidatus Nealsonbacteria bacterium]
MKILMLQDDFPPQSFGGAGISTFYLARGLQKAGHQIFVITTCREKKDEGVCDYQGLKVFRIFADYHPRYRAYLSLYNPQTVNKARELMKQISPDITHAHNIHSYLSYACLKIAKKHSKALFWTARDTMSFTFGKLATKKYLEQFDTRTSWWDHFKEAKKRYNPLRNIIIRHYLKYVDKIFAVTHVLKDALAQNGIKNAEVSYTGIDVDDWALTPDKIKEFREKYGLQDKKIIFFAGRVSGLKGLEQIKQAMVKVKQEIPEALLLIAGKGGIGWLTGEELRAAYHSADIVVTPSIYFDPLNRTNLEGMACKKPIVGTCYGGTPEVVLDGVTGVIVNPFDTELMAQKIIDLLKNDQKAKQFGEAGFERVKKYFNQDAHVSQTLAYYQKI